MPEDN